MAIQMKLDTESLFLKNSFLILEEAPLLRVVFGKGEYENLSGLMTSEQYKEHYRHGIVFMGELIRQWQEEGIIRQLDAEVASNMIASVFYIYLQKETIGGEMYTKVTDMLAECLVNYLSGGKKAVGSQ